MKKQHSSYLVYVLLAIVILTIIISIGWIILPEPAAKVQEFQTISSGSTDDGSVAIDLTPIGYKNRMLEVSIAANTHSIDLSQFDLKEITVLEYEGNIRKPVSAPVLSGHHSSGVLEFDVGKEISKFTIRINGIPSVKERAFEW